MLIKTRMWTLIMLAVLHFSLTFSLALANGEETLIINTNTTIVQDATWGGTVIIDGATVEVQQNVTLTLKPGTIVAGKNGASIVVSGKLVALGEEDKKIRFTEEENRNKNFSLTYSIYTVGGSELKMKNFILEEGGGNKDTSTSSALTIKGKADLSSGIIRRNRIAAVRIWNTDTKLENCEIYENESMALENKTAAKLKVENNWWGSEDEPKNTSSPGGNWLSGSFDADPWQKKGPIPIVIMPGFGGSFSFKLLGDRAKDEWWLPPLGTAAYRHFAKALILNNYYHDKDFFWGFYDWRASCEESAEEYIEPVIAKAKKESGHQQVHILAHSMGGLVARSYIQGDKFRDDVDRLVTAGTPHLGSGETYPVWEGGELAGGKKPITLYLWYLQALDGNWNRVDFIRNNFPALGQMRPIYDYLVDATDNATIPYKTQHGRNEFLEKLAENKDVLKRKITLSLLAGSGEDTLGNIRVLPYSKNDGKWRDGIPEPLPPLEDTTEGDGTVTVKSATGDGKLTEEASTIGSKHGKLLESGEKTILDQLKVKAKFPLIYRALHYFLLSAAGPVEVEIGNRDGRIVSIARREIANSRYELFENGGNKLTYSDFPIEIDGQEKIKLKVLFTGKSAGTLKAAFWNLTENDELSRADVEYPVEEGVKIVFEVSLENLGSGEPKVSVDNVTWSNLLDVTSPMSNQSYLNWQHLSPQASIRKKGENMRDTKIAYEVDGGSVDNRIDLGTLELGLHRLKAKGNWKISEAEQSEEKEIPFVVATSLKSLVTLINRFYEEKRLVDWKTRSTLINLLAEAYQESSNGRKTSAKDKIAEASSMLNSGENVFADVIAKDRSRESLDFLEINPKFN